MAWLEFAQQVAGIETATDPARNTSVRGLDRVSEKEFRPAPMKGVDAAKPKALNRHDRRRNAHQKKE
jgi:hypothetical protein